MLRLSAVAFLASLRNCLSSEVGTSLSPQTADRIYDSVIAAMVDDVRTLTELVDEEEFNATVADGTTGFDLR